MTISIDVYNDYRGWTLPYEFFHFPGGEISVQLTGNVPSESNRINVRAHIKDSDGLMTLFFLMDALSEYKGTSHITQRHLILPYIPYQQQDRKCNTGESRSLRVFCKLLNSLEFTTVTAADPHSEVATALINNCVVETQASIVATSKLAAFIKTNNLLLVSPDAGSRKKTEQLAMALGHSTYVKAEKHRDLQTGRITETEVYAGDLGGKDVLIIDDICVGGKTFTELAAELYKKNAGDVHLYVTHGVFSKGLQPLYDSGIKTIWTTDSYENLILESDTFTVLKGV